MTRIEEQVEDWNKLKDLCTRVQNIRQEEPKKQVLQQLYSGIKNYVSTYKTKFDYINKPK